MKNANVFQIIILVACAFSAIIAMVMFSLFRAEDDSIKSPIVIWGTYSEADYAEVLGEMIIEGVDLSYATYVEINPNRFDAQLLEALASGSGPDLIMLPYDKLLRHKNKLLQISYDSYEERIFQDSFVQGSDVFRDKQYIHALPISVDPLVLYWNRTIFNNNGVVSPPKYWDKVVELADSLTEKDDNATIFQSGIALGVYDNIIHAKDILTTLMLQAGSPIVVLQSQEQSDTGEVLYPRSVIGERSGYTIAPAEGALRFYTQFADPTRSMYSWNTSLPQDREAFARGDLAMYIGRYSEIDDIRKINPNLNFDIATVPQRDSGNDQGQENITHGDFVGIGVIRNSKYITDAFLTMLTLTDKTFAKAWTKQVGLTPVRRDILSEATTSAAESVAYSSAIWSRTYLEPGREKTASVFEAMIESVVSGRYGVNEAIANASPLLQEALNE